MKERNSLLKNLYGNNHNILEYQENRYNNLFKRYCENFDEDEKVKYFSAPGRTELSGNHTDHNGGKVLAASINLDSIACVSKSDKLVEIFSNGFDEEIIVNINELNVIENEKETSRALVRGILSGFVNRGYSIGGFKGTISSDVLVGSGLSSSASFEILVATILNHFYNDGKIAKSVLAQIAQFAENKYFGKPCGLMDQIACAVGGVVAIDFSNNQNPIIENITFDLAKHNYKLLVIDAGVSHQNLTDDYASIPKEMKEVAHYFGKENCSQINFADFQNKLPELYRSVSSRAILRVMHFFKENERVQKQVEALKNDDFEKFITLVNESGNSSFKYLQNIFSPKDVNEQPLSIALAISEDYIFQKKRGACRVHGGGFAGTIQVFLHNDDVDEYRKIVEPIFGKGSVNILDIRNTGASFLK